MATRMKMHILAVTKGMKLNAPRQWTHVRTVNQREADLGKQAIGIRLVRSLTMLHQLREVWSGTR